MKNPTLSFLCLITSMMIAMHSAFPGNNQAGKQNQLVSLEFFDQHRIIDQDVASVLHFYPNYAVIQRFAEVNMNAALTRIHGVSKEQSLVLNVFEDVQLMATISRLITHGNGSFSIIAKIDDPEGYVVISTTGNRSLGSIYIPGLNKYYKIINKPQTARHYLIEMDARNRDILESAPPLIPEIAEEEMLEQLRIKQSIRDGKQGPDDPANIDVMIVYTPAAETWANNNGSGGIENVVAQSMANAQLVLDNSETFATVTLAHSDAVDYVESGSASVDLIRFTASPDYNPWGNFHNGYFIPGFMNEIHEWRDEHAADLSALFAYVSDVGGIAWLLNDINGLPNRGFSLTRVQQAATGYTHIHEMGHNMGLHHHKDQNFQPGPTNWWNWPANVWSAGWRWTGNDGGHYCSVMTYTSGQYFDDGIDHVEVPYFSNPDITYQGQPAGHAVDGDNARTVREIKHVIAAYRSPEIPEVTTADVINIGSTTAWGGGFVANDGGHPLSARGLVWATFENPDLENNEGITFDGSSVGSFASHMTGLSPSTGYYVRAYATNSAGTAYGAQKTFTTLTGESTYPVTFNVNNQSGQPIPNAMITVHPQFYKAQPHPVKMSRSADPTSVQGDNSLLELHASGNTLAGTMPSYMENEKDGQWIKYWESGVNDNALGLGGSGAQWFAAIRWMPEDLVDFHNHAVTKIRVFINDEPNDGAVTIWQGDIDNPIVMVQQAMSVTQEDWVEVHLFDPYLIDTNQELWIGWEIGDPGDGVFPAAFETSSQHDQLANLLQFGDNPWNFASNFGFDVVWNIEAYVAPAGEPDPDPGHIILYTNAAGQASFDALPGAYGYTVEKTGYMDVTGSFSVNYAPVNINIAMLSDSDHPLVTFNVDMTDVAGFDPAQHNVYLTGTLTGWAEPGTEESLEMSLLRDKTPPYNFYENFEDYDDFTTDLSPWITLQLTSGNTWGVSDFSFPGEGTEFAWMAFNPSQTDPPIDGDNPTIDGSRMGMAIQYTNFNDNKWLISPEVSINSTSELSFWARSFTHAYGAERIRVMVSTTGTDPDNFTTISTEPFIEVPIAWTQYTFDLGAYAGETIHFAINYVSFDAFIFWIDAIEITADVEPDPPGELIYTVTVPVEEGHHEYKYFSNAFGDGWWGGEWDGDPYREIYVTGDMVVNDTWGEYDPDPDPDYPVTFNVNNQSGQPIPNAMITVYPERNIAPHDDHKTFMEGPMNAIQRNADFRLEQFATKNPKTFQMPAERDGEEILLPGNWAMASMVGTYHLVDEDENQLGWIFGNNSYGDKACGMVFNVDDPYTIYGAYFWIGSATPGEGDVHFRIYEYNDGVGNLITTQSVPLYDIEPFPTGAGVTPDQYLQTFYVEFDNPAYVNSNYLIAIDYSDLSWNTHPNGVGMSSTIMGYGGGGLDLAYIKDTNDIWSKATSTFTGLNIDLGIFPVISEDYDPVEPIILYTNAAGQASFDAMPGAYSYVVEKDGYLDAAGDFYVIDAPVNINVTLEDDDADYYSIAFSIIDQFNDPVENAVIAMGDMVNEPGDYVFHNVPEGWHVYNVSALCYLPTEGEVLVDHDMAFDVILFIDHLPGDANGDGTVNILDIIAMSIYWSGDEVSNFCFYNADVNNDGEVNILDIIATVAIFNIGKIAPYDDLDSEDAHAFINQQGITLKSDGTLAGLQFELTGDFAGDATLKLELFGYELIQLNTGGTIRAMIYSFDNKPIPAGMISLLTFEGNVLSINMKHGLAGNLNAEEVPLIIHNEMITGVEEHQENAFKAYPNPATNMLRVEFETNGYAKVSLINVHGQLVQEQKVSEQGRHQLRFDTSKLPSGIYMLRLDHAGDFIIKRIMVKKP